MQTMLIDGIVTEVEVGDEEVFAHLVSREYVPGDRSSWDSLADFEGVDDVYFELYDTAGNRRQDLERALTLFEEASICEALTRIYDREEE